MHIIITVLALGILAIGIFASQKVEDSSEEKVLGKENYDQLDVLPTSDLPTEKSNSTEENFQISPSPSSTNLPTTSQQSQKFEKYLYSESKVKILSQSSVTLESSANVDVITDWYKNKIKSEGMTVTSFVVTKTNDNVLNKLVGAKDGEEIRVEIEKKTAEVNTTIQVSLNI